MRTIAFAALLALSFPLLADDDSFTVTAPNINVLDRDGNLDFTVTIRNNAPGELTGVTALLNVTAGVAFVRASGADCAQAADGIHCTLTSVPPHSALVFDVFLKPPPGRGRFVMAMAIEGHYGNLISTVHALATALINPPFVVTTAADDGSGSLRQAIADANRECAAGVPCLIMFAIHEPLPDRGWYTIEPLSPLPPVEAAAITIDGKALNSVPVELRGTYVYADGLVFRGGAATLNGLSIDGFFGNGVVADLKRGGALLISNNIIGSDPNGAPVPNGLRGIAVAGGYGTIRDNVISGNSRSGIFVTSRDSLGIVNNRITNNGASGIYVGPSFTQINVQGNVISGNHDFPIGIDVSAARVAVRENVMADNGAPFDIGMDGPDVHVPPFGSRVEPRPSITSAVYDAASGDTVVTIDVNPLYVNYDTDTLYVFANHGLDRAGRAEAETFLGTVSTPVDARSPKNVTVVFRAHADLRGQIVTALTLRLSPFEFDTQEVSSELSDGVVVR